MAFARTAALLLLSLLALHCGPPSGPTHPRSSAVDEKSEPYFAGPWPDDRRLVNGYFNTLRFPRGGNGSMMTNLIHTGNGVVKGWGLSAPMYVPLTGPIDPTSLPATPRAAREKDSSVFLVSLDPASHDAADRYPLDWKFTAEKTLFLPGNVLAVRPVPGFPLEESTRYALVITTRVLDADGKALSPEPGFKDVLDGKTKDDFYAPLLTWLDAHKVSRSEVAGALIFTTQPVMDDIIAMRDWLEAQPSPALEALVLKESRPGFHVFEGTYKATNLQHGVVPYSLEGGEFLFNADGTPIPDVVEDMRVSLCVPRGAPPPGGFKVVMYSHGTGGDFESVIDDICMDLATQRIAAVGIDQVFHGPRGRGGGGCYGMPIENCFFNPVNVVSGRNSIRQAALDNITLRKMLTVAAVPASLDPDGYDITFDADRVGYFGHSQGGLTGAVYVAFATHLAGAVLSGAGGNLTTTVLVRKDPIDIRALAEGPLLLAIEGTESLDPWHPAIALIQAMGDMADPSSYARYWVKRPQEAPKHLYVTSGMEDPYTNFYTAEVMAGSGEIPQMLPHAALSDPYSLRAMLPIEGPVKDDMSSEDGRAVTAVFRQFPGQGHFPVFFDASARAQWRAFFNGVLNTGDVVVPPP